MPTNKGCATNRISRLRGTHHLLLLYVLRRRCGHLELHVLLLSRLRHFKEGVAPVRRLLTAFAQLPRAASRSVRRVPWDLGPSLFALSPQNLCRMLRKSEGKTDTGGSPGSLGSLACPFYHNCHGERQGGWAAGKAHLHCNHLLDSDGRHHHRHLHGPRPRVAGGLQPALSGRSECQLRASVGIGHRGGGCRPCWHACFRFSSSEAHSAAPAPLRRVSLQLQRTLATGGGSCRPTHRRHSTRRRAGRRTGSASAAGRRSRRASTRLDGPATNAPAQQVSGADAREWGGAH